MKLDLQMFAEEPVVTETAEQEDDMSFEDMYEEGRPEADEDDIDDDEAAIDESDDGEQDIVNATSQPWKNQQNAEFAAQRRRQEEAQRVQQARDEIIRETYAGQINPYTNRPILTEADLRQYQQQYQQDQLQQSGVSPQMLEQIISNHPAVQQAQQVMQQQKQARGQQLLQDEIKAINNIDPDIKSFGDLYNSESFAEIDQRVKRGYSLTDAYRLANMDKITQKRQAAARQQVINQVTGKQHMTKTGSNGAGNELVIPSDVMDMYRTMMPHASDKEIRAHYKAHMKG